MKLSFLRLFDNPLSKYFTFKIISCMQWLFWVIYQNYRGLGLAFAAHFLHDFSIKMFFIWYSIYGQSFNVIPFFLLKMSNKMCYWVLIYIINDVINFKIYLRSTSKAMADREIKRGRWEYKNTKIWISRERKELFRWNKKPFS